MTRFLLALTMTTLIAGSASAQDTAPPVAEPAAAPALSAEAQMAVDLERYRAAYEQEAARSRELAAERDSLKAQATRAMATVTTCDARNVKLQALVAEILDAYRSIGIGDVLARSEPFFGLKRVELENIVQGYGDEAYALRCDARAAPTSDPAPAPVPPTGS
jgi:hypothetical protein